jgi:hypothetical protein
MANGKTNGSRRNPFPESDIYFLKLIAEKASTQIENRMLYESLFESVLHTLTSLIAAINKRDSYTEDHCKRVTETSLRLGRALGITTTKRTSSGLWGPFMISARSGSRFHSAQVRDPDERRVPDHERPLRVRGGDTHPFRDSGE